MLYNRVERDFRLATEDWRAALSNQRKAINEVLDSLPDPLEDTLPNGWQAMYENAHTLLLNAAATEAEAWDKVSTTKKAYITTVDIYQHASDIAKRLANGALTSDDVKFVCDAYNSQELITLRSSKDNNVIAK